MAEQTERERAQAKKRQEIALKKQRQYLEQLSAEEKEQVYEKLHRAPVSIKPATPKDKLSNYWYHYKWMTIIAVFVVVIAAFFIHDMVTKEKYDLEMMLIAADAYDYETLNQTFQSKTKYLDDWNQDGKTNILVTNVEMDMDNVDNADPNYHSAQVVKMSASFSDGTHMIYILDQKNYDMIMDENGKGMFEDLSQYSDHENVDGDKYSLKNDPDLSGLCKDEELFLVIRSLKSHPKSDKESVQKDHKQQLAFVKNILNNHKVS